MDSLDVLAQSWSVMVVRSITSVSSLYLSPVRALPTESDGAHTPGLRGYIKNPVAFVAPWVPKDVVSDVSEIEPEFHESLNLVAAASQLGTSCYSLVIMRGADPARQGVLNATLVTQGRLRNTNVRLGTSDHQEFHPNTDIGFGECLGDLALGVETGRSLWRFKALKKLGLEHISNPVATDDSALSAISMLITGYVISDKNLGDAGTLPTAQGEDGPVPTGGLAWPFPLSANGLTATGGNLPDFGKMRPSDLAQLLQTWDIVIAIATLPKSRDLLDVTSGSFTPWVKDLCRWASIGHHDPEARALYAIIRDSKAFKSHDAAFMSSHALGLVTPVTAHSATSAKAASTVIFGA